MKLEKSSSGSSSSTSKLPLRTSNKESETGSVSSASTRSNKQEAESSGDEDSYNVERIKWLEEFGMKLPNESTNGTLQSRYKKAYKSFKKALKKNTPELLTTSLANIQRSRSAKKNAEPLDYQTDLNNNMNSQKDLSSTTSGSKNDLISFQDDYSYESQANSRRNL